MKKSKIKIIGIATVIIVMLIASVIFMPNAMADPKIIDVPPGADTLKNALATANDGDILKLKVGSYSSVNSSSPVIITKAVTIQGVGSYHGLKSSEYTTVTVPLVVDVENGLSDNKKVVLQGFSSSNQSVTPNFVFLKVNQPVNLELKDVENWGILRGSNGQFQIHDATSLYVANTASGSTINIDKSILDRPGTHYGINVESSDTTINVKNNSVISARNAINLKNGSNNNISITDSSIIGRSLYYTDPEAIKIDNQNKLNLDINNTTIEGTKQKGSYAASIFAFGDDANKSENVTINLTGNTTINENSPLTTSSIFKFGSTNSSSDNNVINVDKTVKINVSASEVSLARKYNTNSKYAVIGLYDHEGNSTIKVYNDKENIQGLDKTTLDGYRFKNWFKDKTYLQSLQESEKVASSSTNLDIYPKFVKLLKVQIGENKYTVEEGQTFGNCDNKEEISNQLNSIAVKEDQEFKGYVVYNDNGSRTYESKEKLLQETITQDCRIEAIHKVSVTINDEKFELDSGATLKSLSDDPTQHDKYIAAKLKNSSDREFSRFVDSKGATFTENDGITKATVLTSKYFVNVTIKNSSEDQTFKIEEEQVLNSSKDIKEALDSLKNTDGKRFGRFIDVSNKSSINPSEKSVTKNITISAVYIIDVKIGEKTYTIDENSNLNSLADDVADIKAELKKLETALAGKNLDGFIVSATNESDEEVLDRDSNNTTDELIEKIMSMNLSKDTTIYAKYNVIVTIKGKTEDNDKTFEIETGETLEDVAKKYVEEYESAKYRGKNHDRFSRFVSDGQTFEETEEIQNAITLTPKYLVFVTMDEVIGKIEEGSTIDEFSGDTKSQATSKLNEIRSNKDNLHFEKLVVVKDDGSTQDLPSNINEDITIKGIYHYDLNIVEDYDNASDSNKVKGYTVHEGKSLNDSESDKELAKESLQKLKDSATKKDGTRKFHSYFEKNLNREVTEEEILSTNFNTHSYINALVSYKVVIGDVTDYVVEGKTLKESEEGKLVAALENLKQSPTDKTVDKIVVNGKKYDIEAINGDTVINEYTEISADYTVQVSINNHIFVLPIGSCLDEMEAKKDEINTALEEVKNDIIAKGYNFKGYIDSDGTDFTTMTKVSKNTVISAKYNIEITIKGATGTKKFEIDSGKTLSDIQKSNSTDYDEVKKKTDRTFLYFIVNEDNTILKDGDTAYKFMKNLTLTSIYAVTITIEENEYPLREGTKLSSDDKIITALKNLQKSDKDLVEFQDESGSLVATLEQIESKEDNEINENLTIVPKYLINVEIVGNETYKKTVDENTKLKDIGYTKPKNFMKYVDYETGDEVLEDTPLTKNTKLKAIYKITVSINDNDYEIESFKTFKDVQDLEGAKDDLEILKEVPANRKSFSRFVFIKDDKEIELKDDTILTSDIKVIPKFTVEITVIYTTKDNEKEELVKIELEEGKTISDLSVKELQKLNEKLKEREEQLEKEGKHNFKFSKFITVDGHDIDLKTTLFKDATTIEAVFEYKSEQTPSGPNQSGDYPFKEKAPNTSVTKDSKNYQSIVYGIVSSLIIVICSLFGYKIYKKN